MDNVSPGAFKLFVQWVDGQKLDIGQLRDLEERDILDAKDENWTEKEDMHLAELWVLGDKLMAPQLQNLAIEAIITIANEDSTSPLATFPYIYENTVEGSPLRILARQFCSINMREEYSKHFDLFRNSC